MARNPNSDSWNQNHRYSQSDDRIMRRGDDRTIESRDWGSSQQQGQGRGEDRNSYRTDDYATDKEMYRAGGDHYDRDMAYGNYGSRNNQSQGQQNFNQGSSSYPTSDRGQNSSYGWSSDYRSSQDYRPNYERSNYDRSNHDRFDRQDRYDSSSGFSSSDRSYGRQDGLYGQGGDLSSSRSYGSGMSNFGSSTSDSLKSDSMRGGSFGSSGYGSSIGSGSYGSMSGFGSSQYVSPQYGSSQQSNGQHYGKGPKNYRRSDDRIKEEVSDALERNAHIDASEIEVEVKEGIVTLRGHVEDRHTKRLTEDLVMGLYGVKDVRNDLTVDQSIFTQARNMLFGETAESQSASSTNSNKSTATKSKH